MKKNNVFIATSLDGYIADKEGGLDWLDLIPNPEKLDHGYFDFIKEIDAFVMGRSTFETVLGFGIEWPYKIPVFVLSNSLKKIPKNLIGKVFIINGTLSEILNKIHAKGYDRLYIDGGITIQNFLKEDLIDEMIITTVPILLGSGTPLFSEMPKVLEFELVSSTVFLNQLTQRHYRRKRS